MNRPLVYKVDKSAVREIERQGMNIDNLSFVNLRSFKTERELFHELVLDDGGKGSGSGVLLG